jgi:hypothetical protein
VDATVGATVTVTGPKPIPGYKFASGNTSITAGAVEADNLITLVYDQANSADLTSLSLSSGSLSPDFDAAITSYTASVANDVTSVTATASSADGNIVAVTGDGAMAVGDNTITITVDSNDGLTQKVYTVVVNRVKSSNADLSALSLSVGTLAPAFDAAVTSYTASVANDVTSVTVTATKADATANVVVVGGSDLAVGDNTITATVTAQDGVTVKTYTITVNRAMAPMELVGNIPDFVAGFTSTYTISTIANGDAGKMVRAYFTIPEGATVEYLEVQNGQWYPLSSVFGPSTGFPLGDNTSTFRASSTVVGSQTVTVTFKLVSDGSVLCTKDLTFNVVAASTACDLVSVNGIEVPGSDLTVNVPNNQTTYVVDAVVSPDATWALYSDAACTTEIADKTMNLNVGANLAYIKVTAQDGITYATYPLTVVRDTSYAVTEVTGATVGEGAITGVDKDATYAAFIASVTTDGGTAKVFSGATELASDALVGTGMTLKTFNGNNDVVESYTLTVYADSTGDGMINSADMLATQQSILGVAQLSGVYADAADSSRNGKVNSTDLLITQRIILGLETQP